MLFGDESFLVHRGVFLQLSELQSEEKKSPWVYNHRLFFSVGSEIVARIDLTERCGFFGLEHASLLQDDFGISVSVVSKEKPEVVEAVTGPFGLERTSVFGSLSAFELKERLALDVGKVVFRPFYSSEESTLPDTSVIRSADEGLATSVSTLVDAGGVLMTAAPVVAGRNSEVDVHILDSDPRVLVDVFNAVRQGLKMRQASLCITALASFVIFFAGVFSLITPGVMALCSLFFVILFYSASVSFIKKNAL